jgi:hypothetical protein
MIERLLKLAKAVHQKMVKEGRANAYLSNAICIGEQIVAGSHAHELKDFLYFLDLGGFFHELANLGGFFDGLAS